MSKLSVQNVLEALQIITGGRVVTRPEDISNGCNPYVTLKTSHIPGKEVMEIPGLIYGDPDMPVKKLAVVMTLTESVVELAASLGIDALVAHHPVADAASCGGVSLKDYLYHYKLAIFELHEAFHGLHPGIALLHGHVPIHTDVCYRGAAGNVIIVGKPLAEIRCLKDILDRLETLMGRSHDTQILEAERRIYENDSLQEINALEGGAIINGHPDNEVGIILHCFPHTGFSLQDLNCVLHEHPGIKTVITSISKVRRGHPLIGACREKGLNLVAGNSHALEIWENGLPLAYALQALLDGVEVTVFRERVTSFPLAAAGTRELRKYARQMAFQYLPGNRNQVDMPS